MATVQSDRLRALIVEDYRDDAQCFALLLQKKGWRVAVCDDASRAVAIANEFRPCVIFMDIRLRGDDGIDVARTIKQQPLPPYLLVARTGLADSGTRARCTDTGFDSIFLKPGDQQQLDDLLATARSMAHADGAPSNG